MNATISSKDTVVKKCQNMQQVREEIDRVDQLIVPLLVERLGYIEQAGHIKQDRDTVRDEWRVEDVVSKAKAASDKLDGNSSYIETIYRHLIEYSINHEFDVWDDAN